MRKTPDGDRYEILAGHNRVNAAKLAGWTEIPAEAVEADDARAIVIAIRKAVKLTRLIPELLETLENSPKRLLLSCADLIADYDAESQTAFAQICAVEERRRNLGTMRLIVRQCPPPAADADNILAVWNAAGAEESRPTKSCLTGRSSLRCLTSSAGT